MMFVEFVSFLKLVICFDFLILNKFSLLYPFIVFGFLHSFL